MANLTTNQLIVGIMNVAVGGFKTDVEAFVAANGEYGLADALLPQSGLNPVNLLGVPLFDNAQFVTALIERLIPTISGENKTAVVNLLVEFLEGPFASLSRGAFAVEAIKALLAADSTADPAVQAAKTAFEAKVALADAYTGDSTDLTVLAGVVGGVTPAPVVNFNLTTGQDTFTPDTTNPAFRTTSADELFKAALNTLSNGDKIISGGGNDRLEAELTLDLNNLAALVHIEGVKTLSFNVLGGGSTINAAKITGAQVIEHTGSGNLELINLLDTSTTFKMIGTSSNLDLTPIATAVLAANDTAKVVLEGTAGGTLTVAAGYEMVHLTSSGAKANVLGNIAGAGAAAILIDGGAGIQLNEFAAAVTLIDARQAGTATLKTTGVGATTTILTGAQDSTLTTDVLGATNVVRMGAADDTLTLTAGSINAAAVLQGVENIKVTGPVAAGAVTLDLAGATDASKIDLATTPTAASTITNMAAGSSVKASVALGANDLEIGFRASATGQALDFQMAAGSSAGGDKTFTNVKDLTLTATGSTETTFDSTILTAKSTSLTVNNESVRKFETGNITTTAGLQTLTVTQAGQSGSIVVGTVTDATVLGDFTVNATGGVVTVGAVGGGTASTGLTKVEVNAGHNVKLGNVSAANTAGVSSIALNATGGAIGNDGIANPAATATTFTNTGGNIKAVTLSGSKDINAAFVSATTGYVENIASTNTGSTTLAVTNATTGPTVGSSIKLGDAVTGKENKLTVNSVGNHTIEGGTGLDELTLDGGYDAATAAVANETGYVINLSDAAQTLGSLTVQAGNIKTLNGAALSATNTATTATVSGIEKLVSGDGADIIFGSAVSNTITGGAGNDTINAGAGSNSITDAGIDADTVIHNTKEATVAVAVTGAGTVTLTASEAGATATTSDGAAAGNRHVDASTSTAAVALVSGVAGAHSVTLIGGTAADTITVNGALTGNASLTGGDGVDTFVIKAGLVDDNTITDLGKGGADVVQVATGAAVTAVLDSNWTATSATKNEGASNAAAVIRANGKNVDLSAITTGKGFTVNNRDAADAEVGTAITVVGSGLGDSIASGAGNDTITVTKGSNTINADAGNDTINVAGTSANTVTTGTGNDTVNLTTTGGAQTINVTLANGNVNAIKATGAGATYTVAITSAGGVVGTVNVGDSTQGVAIGGVAAAGDDSIVGGFGNDTITTTAGSDTVTGALGADTFIVTDGTMNITDLGQGADVLQVTGGTAVATVHSTGFTATAATSNAGATAANARIETAGYTVNLSAVTTDKGFTLVNTSGSGTTLTGTKFADNFVGGTGNDTIVVGEGNNTVMGGQGNDSINLTGGGDDIVIFAGANTQHTVGSVARIATLGTDTITGFQAEVFAADGNGAPRDKIQLSISDFGSIGALAIDADLTAAVLGVAAGVNTALNAVLGMSTSQAGAAGTVGTFVHTNALTTGAGAFVLVGALGGTGNILQTNTNYDLYFVKGAATAGITIQAAVEANAAVRIATIGVVEGTLALGNFEMIA